MTRLESFVVVVGGGDLPSAGIANWLTAEIDSHNAIGATPAIVVAVDHGLDHAQKMRISANIVVGDMDSVSASGLTAARQAGTRVEAFSPDKDYSDLELALSWIGENVPGPRRVVYVAVAGGRWDHEIINLAVVGNWANVHDEVTIVDDRATIHVVVAGSPPTRLQGPVGTTISLQSLGEAATGVHFNGVKWPLNDAVLTSGSSLALSNVSQDQCPTVSCRTGRLLAIVPNEAPHRHRPR